MRAAAEDREEWVVAVVVECEAGKAPAVVEALRGFEGRGDSRVRCLSNYLEPVWESEAPQDTV